MSIILNRYIDINELRIKTKTNESYKRFAHGSSCVLVSILIYIPEEFVQSCIPIQFLLFLLESEQSKGKEQKKKTLNYEESPQIKILIEKVKCRPPFSLRLQAYPSLPFLVLRMGKLAFDIQDLQIRSQERNSVTRLNNNTITASISINMSKDP